MRKTGSLLYLTVAASFGRVLIILAGMAVVQLGVAAAMPRFLPQIYGAPYVFSHWAFRLPAAAALILVMYTLMRSHGSRPTQTGYTMLRLPVAPGQVFLSYLVYAVAVLLLCWFAQLAVVVAAARLLAALYPAFDWGEQLLFLTSVQSGYVHALLPLLEGWSWANTTIIYVGLGFITAVGMVRSWQGKLLVWPFLFPLALSITPLELRSHSWSTVMAALLVVGCCVEGGLLVSNLRKGVGE